MKKVFLVYTADCNLMNDSKQLIGVCSTKPMAIKLLKAHLGLLAIDLHEEKGYNDAHTMLTDLINNLTDLNQTQTLETNYMIEQMELDAVDIMA